MFPSVTHTGYVSAYVCYRAATIPNLAGEHHRSRESRALGIPSQEPPPLLLPDDPLSRGGTETAAAGGGWNGEERDAGRGGSIDSDSAS